MKNDGNRPDASDLLEAFVASNRSERAFTALVGNLSGLVYSSALRRTQNPQLAEEVMQNVFAILARKAESLRRHPALIAWVLETTRLQAASAMRSEKRRQRKIAALSSEAKAHHSESSDPMNQEALWKDAVPILDEVLDHLPLKERKIILERFYEGRKFKEIAARSGQTEGACKMRLKRALEKLSTSLRARGVTLSVTVVASALGTELARSAPVHTVAAIAPKALAASSSISTTIILANSLQTMSTFKTTTLTAAAVLALAFVPLSRQFAEGSRMQSRLRTLEASQPAVQPGSSKTERTRLRSAGSQSMNVRTAENLLASLEQPADSRAVLLALMRHAYADVPGGDSFAQKLAFMRISQMSPEEHAQLREELEQLPCDGKTKEQLADMISPYGPESTPRERLDRMILAGRGMRSQRIIKEWAAEDPDAALNWYREKLADGELHPGLTDSLHQTLATFLMAGLASSRPEQALELYRETPRKDSGRGAAFFLASVFTEQAMESGDDTHLVKFLDANTGENRDEAMRSAFQEYVGKGRMDEALAFAGQHDPNNRKLYLGELKWANSVDEIAEGLDWVLAGIPEAEAPRAMEKVITGMTVFERFDQAADLLGRQAPGSLRDRGYARLVHGRIRNGKFEQAMNEVDNIEGAALLVSTRQAIARKWLERAPVEASEALPADLLDQLQNK